MERVRAGMQLILDGLCRLQDEWLEVSVSSDLCMKLFYVMDRTPFTNLW